MLGTAAVIAAGFGGPLHRALDTLSNFRLHLSAGLALLAAIWSLRCSRAPALVFALISFFGVASSSAGLPLPLARHNPAGGETVHTAFVMNLLWNNSDIPAVMRKITELEPEILLLTEYAHQWIPPVAELAKRYPYTSHCPEWAQIGGSIILSTFPLAGDGTERCSDYAGAGFADFVIGDVAVTLGIVHLRWPWPAGGPRQIDNLEPMLGALPENVLVAGDFNSVTWSHAVKRFARMGGLSIVEGIGPTWGPSFTIAGRRFEWPQALGLPIDNAMAKGAVRIVSARRLEPLGSDHLPIVIKFVVE